MNRTLEMQQKQQERAQFISTMTAKRDTLLSEAEAIHQKAMTETRALTAEEVTQFDAKMTEADSVKKTLDLTAKFSNAYSDAGPGGRTEVHNNAEDEPWWGYEVQGEETKAQRTKRLEIGFGKYLDAVRKGTLANQVGRQADIDPRLVALNENFQKRAAAAGSSEAVPSDGGFLIAPDFSEQLLELAHDTGVVYPLTREMPISEFTNTIKVPAIDEFSRKDGYRSGGIQCFWENEASQLVGSKPTFQLIELVLAKLTGLYYATNELLADSRLLGSFVMRAFGEEIGFKLDQGVISGTGGGQLAGILNSPALITVPTVAGQATKTIVTPNILAMWGRMWTPSRKNAVWLINQDCEQQISQLSMTVGTTGGIPVFIPAGNSIFGALAAPPLVSAKGLAGLAGYLLGRPCYVIEQCQTLGTAGDIILADLQQYLMIKKDGLQTASSQHVRFLSDEMTYRWIYRTQGQSWFKSAITPYSGTNTLSPWVVLQTR
jgi:HK97 family phage major capsid protein